MSTLESLKKAIEALPEKDYATLRQWFSERDWDNWDRQIEADSNSGALEFLAREARNVAHDGGRPRGRGK